ncbi:MAG TPA: hypothetical protein VGI80_04450, partial [Pyrinomonadaceae bacterium]
LNELSGQSKPLARKLAASERTRPVADPRPEPVQVEVEYKPNAWESDDVEDSSSPVEELEIFLL